MKVKLSWFQTIVEVVNALAAVLSFLVAVAEIVHEGPKLGEQKKQWVLQQWDNVRKVVRDALADVFEGDKILNLWDLISNPKIVSIVIDILVFLFNLKGFFQKSS